MMNIEYYGINNLICRTMNAGLGLYECEFYYRPKHGNKNILVKSIIGTLNQLSFEKARWLLSEAKHTNVFNNISAKHVRRSA
jgi:hypothetical protein